MSSPYLTKTMPPSALIVEDEPDLRTEIKRVLHLLWPELEIVGEAQDGLEALQMIEAYQPDIVFLDIQIPGPNGLQIAREIDDRFTVVFITAYDEHAVEAFERGAMDYILKPIQSERLALTVQRLKKNLQQPNVKTSMPAADIPLQPERARYVKWITATSGNTFRLVMTDEVVFFQADNRYTRVVLANSEVLISKSLKELLEELDPDQFWQVHRSTIVNAAEIARIEPDMAGRLCVVLKNRRETLVVSDSFMRKFRQM